MKAQFEELSIQLPDFQEKDENPTQAYQTWISMANSILSKLKEGVNPGTLSSLDGLSNSKLIRNWIKTISYASTQANSKESIRQMLIFATQHLQSNMLSSQIFECNRKLLQDFQRQEPSKFCQKLDAEYFFLCINAFVNKELIQEYNQINNAMIEQWLTAYSSTELFTESLATIRNAAPVRTFVCLNGAHILDLFKNRERAHIPIRDEDHKRDGLSDSECDSVFINRLIPFILQIDGIQSAFHSETIEIFRGGREGKERWMNESISREYPDRKTAIIRRYAPQYKMLQVITFCAYLFSTYKRNINCPLEENQPFEFHVYIEFTWWLLATFRWVAINIFHINSCTGKMARTRELYNSKYIVNSFRQSINHIAYALIQFSFSTRKNDLFESVSYFNKVIQYSQIGSIVSIRNFPKIWKEFCPDAFKKTQNIVNVHYKWWGKFDPIFSKIILLTLSDSESAHFWDTFECQTKQKSEIKDKLRDFYLNQIRDTHKLREKFVNRISTKFHDSLFVFKSDLLCNKINVSNLNSNIESEGIKHQVVSLTNNTSLNTEAEGIDKENIDHNDGQSQDQEILNLCRFADDNVVVDNDDDDVMNNNNNNNNNDDNVVVHDDDDDDDDDIVINEMHNDTPKQPKFMDVPPALHNISKDHFVGITPTGLSDNDEIGLIINSLQRQMQNVSLDDIMEFQRRHPNINLSSNEKWALPSNLKAASVDTLNTVVTNLLKICIGCITDLSMRYIIKLQQETDLCDISEDQIVAYIRGPKLDSFKNSWNFHWDVNNTQFKYPKEMVLEIRDAASTFVSVPPLIKSFARNAAEILPHHQEMINHINDNPIFFPNQIPICLPLFASLYCLVLKQFEFYQNPNNFCNILQSKWWPCLQKWTQSYITEEFHVQYASKFKKIFHEKTIEGSFKFGLSKTANSNHNELQSDFAYWRLSLYPIYCIICMSQSFEVLRHSKNKIESLPLRWWLLMQLVESIDYLNMLADSGDLQSDELYTNKYLPIDPKSSFKSRESNRHDSTFNDRMRIFWSSLLEKCKISNKHYLTIFQSIGLFKKESKFVWTYMCADEKFKNQETLVNGKFNLKKKTTIPTWATNFQSDTKMYPRTHQVAIGQIWKHHQTQIKHHQQPTQQPIQQPIQQPTQQLLRPLSNNHQAQTEQMASTTTNSTRTNSTRSVSHSRSPSCGRASSISNQTATLTPKDLSIIRNNIRTKINRNNRLMKSTLSSIGNSNEPLKRKKISRKKQRSKSKEQQSVICNKSESNQAYIQHMLSTLTFEQ